MTTWDRFRNQNTTGLEIRTRTGGVFYPRSYCDDPSIGPVGIYTGKSPVCKLSLIPVVQFVNTSIAFDISDSRSATSTIDTFDIAWGGTTDIGDLADQAWASDPLTGNVQYTTLGTYTVTASVTDVLGQTSNEVKITVQIVEKEQRVYIGSTDSGVFVMTTTTDPTASNSGLSGTQLNIRALRVHPAYRDLPAGQQHIWIATQDGVSYSTDGAATWTNISKATMGTPTNSAGDDPAPATADLDQIDIGFCVQDTNRIYVLRTTATRAWLYYSSDYGTTWSNTQVSS